MTRSSGIDDPHQGDTHVPDRPSFSFADASLATAVAHDGVGEVLAQRVLDRVDSAGLRFVDLVEVPPGSTIGRHTHGSDEELYIVISGRAIVELEGKPVSVGPGDVALNRPGGTHALVVEGDAVLRMVVVCVAA